VHAQTEAVYRLMAGLTRDHPGLEIESCSSGGGRIDHGVLDIADRVWVSDDNDPLERLRINRWTAQLVPPEMMGTHIASPESHTTGRTHSLAFRAAVALFGHLGVEWDIRSLDPQQRRELADWIRLHKDHRELIRSGRLVRSDTADPRIAVQGVVSDDRARALYLFAQTAILDTSTVGRITLPGLDPQRRYLVTVLDPGAEIRPGHQAPWQGLERAVFPGGVLAHAGLVMPSLRPERAVLIDVRAEA
jgi:alpha-galactosidase